MARETTGPWAEAVDEVDEELEGTDELEAIRANLPDYTVDSGHHSVKRPGAEIHLSGEEPHVETTVTVTADEDEHTRDVPLSLVIKSTDHGMEEGMASADLSVEEAEDLHERLGTAIEAAKEGKRYYER